MLLISLGTLCFLKVLPKLQCQASLRPTHCRALLRTAARGGNLLADFWRPPTFREQQGLKWRKWLPVHTVLQFASFSLTKCREYCALLYILLYCVLTNCCIIFHCIPSLVSWTLESDTSNFRLLQIMLAFTTMQKLRRSVFSLHSWKSFLRKDHVRKPGGNIATINPKVARPVIFFFFLKFPSEKKRRLRAPANRQ